MYDVIIIGAGVTGAFIARELSRYDLKVCLFDKEADVAMGTSKANSAIVHAGYDADPASLKAILNVRGNRLMKQTAEELHVKFKRTGSLVLCFDNKDIPKLEDLLHRGKKNGVEGLTILWGDKLKEMEPAVSPHAVAALYAPSAGIICPFELTLHAAENAVENGVDLELQCEVCAIRYEDGLFLLDTTKGEFKTKYLVNAAGLYSDKISKMLGDASYTIHPRKGEYVLLDKDYGGLVNKVIFQLPSNKGKGVLVTPTVDGNLLVGPNAQEVQDTEDKSTTDRGLSEVFRSARLSVPSLNPKGIITSFAGLRATPQEGDFVIRASSFNHHFIHAAGIESPGLTASPAIGERVVALLKENGLKLIEKKEFNPVLTYQKAAREMDEDMLNALIRKNPEYGRIVCRCEKVTEGDVMASIHRIIGARDLDAVKRRTRAGIGRCQGGFCSPRIVDILSRELNSPIEKITKFGRNSCLLTGKTK